MALAVRSLLRASPSWLLLCLLLGAARIAYALSFGGEMILSRLGDPVEVEIPILQWQEIDLDTTEVTAGTDADYRNFGLQRQGVVDSLDFNIVGPDLDGNVRVLVSSREPMYEPYLELLVVLRWPGGSMLREFVLLFDPPPVPVTAPAVVVAPDVSPAPAIVETPADAPVTVADTVPTVPAPPPQVLPEREPDRLDEPFVTDFRTQYAVEVQSVSRDRRQPPQTGRSHHLVTLQDSLWGIASTYQPRGEDADRYQYMLAMHALNEAAFVNGNIALLKVGETLELPARQDLARIDRDSARDAFERLWAADTLGFTAPALEAPEEAPAAAPPEVTQELLADAGLPAEIPAETEEAPLIQPDANSIVLRPAEADAVLPVAEEPAENVPASLSVEPAVDPQPEAAAIPELPAPELPVAVAEATAQDESPAQAQAGQSPTVPAIAPSSLPQVVDAPDVDVIIRSRQQRLEEMEDMVVLMRVRMQEAEAVAAELNGALARELERRADRETRYEWSAMVLTGTVVVLLAALAAAVVLLLKMHVQLGAQQRLLQARTTATLRQKLQVLQEQEAVSALAAVPPDHEDDVPAFGPAER